MFTRGHIILALETQLEPGRSYADRSHNYISDIRLQIVITVALCGNQQARLTTTMLQPANGCGGSYQLG